MPQAPDVDELAAALRVSVGLLLRRLRQIPNDGELTLPETAALARLDRSGPATSAALARLEQISPQSIGTTLAALEARGLIRRSADPQDGRRVILSLTDGGSEMLRNRRNHKTTALADALRAQFAPSELGQLAAVAPLLERLAQSI